LLVEWTLEAAGGEEEKKQRRQSVHEEIIRSGEPGVGDLSTVQTTRLESPTAVALARSLAAGVILVARDSEEGTLLGEIHAYGPEPRAFSQVLSDLTIAVHPAAQGRAIDLYRSAGDVVNGTYLEFGLIL